MNSDFFGRVRKIGLIAACCTSSGIAVAATPPPPQVQPQPTGLLEVNFATSQSVTFSWFQPLAAPKQPPVDAGTFAICLQDPNYLAAHPCETQLGGSSSNGVWTRPATDASLHQSPVYIGSPFSPNRVLTGYNYWTTLTLSNGYYDRSLRWSLAACVTKTSTTCTSVGAPFAWYTTKALGGNPNIEIFRPSVKVTAGAYNFGTSDVDAFVSRITGYQALVGASGTCAINPNESGLNVTNSSKFITRSGQVLSAAGFRSGTAYDVSTLEMIAIVNTSVSFGATAGPPGTVFGPPFAPLPLAFQAVNGNPVLTAMATRDITITSLPLQPNQASLPAAEQKFAIAAVVSIDDLNQIKEVNEGDNKGAECRPFTYQ